MRLLSSQQWQHSLSQLSRVLGPDSASRELRWMLQSLERNQSPDRQQTVNTLCSMVARRVSGEPLQYILGTQPFGSLNLLTRPPVLIPRPETEDWTIRFSRRVRPAEPSSPLTMLDLCTGSGCIALLLCELWPPGTVRAWGIDISADAVQLARDNAKLCELNAIPPTGESPTASRSARNTFEPLRADMRDPAFVHNLKSAGLCPPFDVITSNPPYIPKREYENLPTSVRDYEDVRALLGDPESDGENKGRSQSARGLTFYHDIARLVAGSDDSLLAKDGVLAVEVGKGQAREVESILREEGNLTNTTVWKDPWDIERVVVAAR